MTLITTLMIVSFFLTPIAPSRAEQSKRAEQAQKETNKKEDALVQAVDPKKVKQEVQEAFDEWKYAYAEGQKGKFLRGFANVSNLTVRVSVDEWIGFKSFQDTLSRTEMLKTSFPFKDVRIVPIDEYAALVTYVRPSSAKDEKGRPLLYRGTLVYAKTYSGWKIIAWHSHSLVELTH